LSPQGRSSSGWVVAGVGLPFGALLADFMAVSVALPGLQRAMDATFSQLIWVLEAYVLSLGTFLLVFGFVLARLGLARALCAGSLTFAAGAFLAGAAPGLVVVIIARAVQGAGSALVLSAGPLLLAATFSDTAPRNRATKGAPRNWAGKGPLGTARLRQQAAPRGKPRPPVGSHGSGAWPALSAFYVAVAPLAGGLVTAQLSWRYLFYIEAAMGVLGPFALARTMRPGEVRRAEAGVRPGEVRRAEGEVQQAEAGVRPGEVRPVEEADLALRQAGRPDWVGVSLFAGAAVLAVAGLVRVTYNLESWPSSGVFACLACAGLLLVAFVAKEVVATPPALPLALFARRSFTGASAAALGLSVAVIGPFPLLALYMARELGYGETGAGLRLLALSGMALPGAVLVALAAKWLGGRGPSARWLLPGGLALVAGGMWLLSREPPANGWGGLWPGLALSGAGYEMASPRLASAAAASVPLEEAPLAARATSVVRQFGAAIGVALAASVFAVRLAGSIGQQLGAPARLAGEPPVLAARVLAGDVPQAARQAGTGVLKAAFAAGLHEVLALSALVAAGCAVVALIVGTEN